MTFLDEATWRGKAFSSGWTAVSGGEAPVTEPATGAELGRVGIASPADIAAAATAAAAAQPAWAALPHTERSAILRRAGDIWKAHAEEIEGWSIREGGKIGPAAQFETHVATEEIYEAATLPSRPYGELLPTESPHLSWAERVPVGVVGVISPVQLPADPGHPVGGPGARPRQRGGAEARPAHRGVRRRGAGPRLRGGRAARGGAACAAGRPGRRGSPDHRPAGAGDLVHRVHLGGPPCGRAGRAASQAGAPGTGRQLRPDRAGRRRPGRGRVGRGVGLVPAPGPDLHDHRPSPGPGRRLRRLRGRAGRQGQPPAGRRPGQRPGGAGPHHRRAAARQGPRPGHLERGRGGPAGRGRHLRGPVLPAHRAG